MVLSVLAIAEPFRAMWGLPPVPVETGGRRCQTNELEQPDWAQRSITPSPADRVAALAS